MHRRLQYLLRSVFRRSAVEREMRDEMQHHLEQTIERLVARGLPRGEAEKAARREFGNVALHEEHARDARGTGWIDALRGDVRFAFRYFARKPLASATIVLVLALGIGGHAFQFSMVLAIFTRTNPGVPRDIPLVRVRAMQRAKNNPEWWRFALSYPEVRDVAGLRSSFARVAAWTSADVVMSAKGNLDGVTTDASFVTDDYFSVLELQPSQGPGLPRSGATDPLAAVISYATWEDLFDRADVSGRELNVNGIAVRIVGVAPPDFVGPLGDSRRAQIWMPVAARATILRANGATAFALASVDSALFEMIGQLQPGVAPEQATAAVRVVATRSIARLTPPPPGNANVPMVYDADVVRLRGITEVSSDMPRIAVVWEIITLLVLLVACANVTGMAVSSAVGRRQEMAIRISLGASRRRVIRQMLTESTILAAMGGALGLFLYWVIIKLIASHEPDAAFVKPGAGAVALTMLVALGTGVLFGLTPAWHATRRGVSEVLKGVELGATRRSRAQGAFIVAQITLTQPLLMLFAYLIASMLLRLAPPLPHDLSQHVLRLSFQGQSLAGSDAQRAATLQRFEQHLRETPGVTQVTGDPRFIRSATMVVRDEDRGSLPRARDPVVVDMYLARQDYFAFIDTPLLRGTARAPADTAGVMIISSDLARDLWGDADPIGRRLVQVLPAPTGQIKRELVVTGVYDARYIDKGSAHARVFRPVNTWWNDQQVLVRTAPLAADLATPVLHAAREALPSTPIDVPVTLAQVQSAEAKEARNIQAAVAGAAVLMLLLTSIGLYGIVALGVVQRRREIGIRMALGAQAREVVGLLASSGVKLSLLGLALGLPLSLVGRKLLEGQLARSTTSQDIPSVWLMGGVIAGVVLVVASVAALLPASRAAMVDPVSALRSE